MVRGVKMLPEVMSTLSALFQFSWELVCSTVEHKKQIWGCGCGIIASTPQALLLES